MQWYYSKNGTQQGPIPDGEMRGKLASGEISPTDMVWREGMRDWQPASMVGELATPAAGSPVTAGAPPVLSGNPQASPYTPPMSQASPLPPGQEIPNYLWQSIVVTIFCCWPFGIPAIVYAAKVDSLKARGDIAGAMAASASAKTWCMVSVGVIVAFVLLWMIGAVITGITQH